MIVGILIISNLFGCSVPSGGVLQNINNYESKNDDEILKATFQVIVDSLVNKNIELLKSIMSDNALNTDDFEDGFEYCCNLLDGEITEIKQKGSPIYTHLEKGNKWKKGDAEFHITIDSKIVYIVNFEYWYSCESDPGKLGVDRIKISNMSDTNFISMGNNG